MNTHIVISHFFQPRWEIVNKIAAIAKSSDIEYIHCSIQDKLKLTLGQLSPTQKVLLFSDEGCVDLIREIVCLNFPVDLEIALFVKDKLPEVAEKICDLDSIRYLIDINKDEGFGRNMAILMRKFREDDILDLNKYLAFGADLHRRSIVSSETKIKAIGDLHNFIINLGDPDYSLPFAEYARRISEMTDELVVNAIYHANPRMRETDRGAEFTLDRQEEIIVTWGYDGENFGISVRDPHGRFNRETILKYLSSQRGLENILTDQSGGLGLKFIFERAHQLIANVKNKSVTEVIALVSFESRLRTFESKNRFFFYFTSDEENIKNKHSEE